MDDAPGSHESCQAWQRGEAAAFAALVGRWQQPLARFLAGMMGRTDLIEDLCQEVFLRVFLARARYRETGAFASWLYRIARNVARDAVRRHRAQSTSHPLTQWGSGKLVEISRQSLAPGQSMPPCEQEELAEAILAGLAELPWEIREVVVLRHFQGMKFKEIADLTGLPASTLRCRFEVGMGRLRKHLEQRGWGPEENPT